MPRNSSLIRRDALVSLALVVVCGGILALFTDVELTLVRWVNCGPLAGEESRRSSRCRWAACPGRRRSLAQGPARIAASTSARERP